MVRLDVSAAFDTVDQAYPGHGEGEELDVDESRQDGSTVGGPRCILGSGDALMIDEVALHWKDPFQSPGFLDMFS